MDLKAEFEQIVTANQDWLYRYILSMVKNKQTAEDLVQEVFISAYRSWDCYEERGKLRNWLRIIARNMAVRHLQADNGRQMVSIYADLGSADDDLYILDTLAGAESPERDAFDRELLQQILAAINELPDHQRQVFIPLHTSFSVNMTAKLRVSR